jgi:hypothetical protein
MHGTRLFFHTLRGYSGPCGVPSLQHCKRLQDGLHPHTPPRVLRNTPWTTQFEQPVLLIVAIDEEAFLLSRRPLC